MLTKIRDGLWLDLNEIIVLELKSGEEKGYNIFFKYGEGRVINEETGKLLEEKLQAYETINSLHPLFSPS